MPAVGRLTHPEGDLLNDGFAEGRLKSLKNFLPSITDDFVEPDAAIHIHEQGAFGEACRLRMGHQGGV
jgi:hypothetical protein